MLKLRTHFNIYRCQICPSIQRFIFARKVLKTMLIRHLILKLQRTLATRVVVPVSIMSLRNGDLKKRKRSKFQVDKRQRKVDQPNKISKQQLQYPLTANLVNSSPPGQNGRHFADDLFKSIFLNENVWISIKISLNFVSKGPINNIQALVQIMAWRRIGDKPLSEPMLTRFSAAYMRH